MTTQDAAVRLGTSIRHNERLVAWLPLPEDARRNGQATLDLLCS